MHTKDQRKVSSQITNYTKQVSMHKVQYLYLYLRWDGWNDRMWAMDECKSGRFDLVAGNW